MATDERPSRKFVKKSESPFAGAKERVRNALITGTAGGYLGGMLIEGKARVKVPAFTRKLLRMKRKTIGIHGARTGAAIGAAVGASNRGKRSETVDSVATGGDWKFSAYIEDMTFGSLPKEVQKDVQRFVTAEKGTPVVHYGMTVKELLGKADPENLKAARKALGTLRASKAADEVINRTKDGSKYVLIMNDRIVDGHHFLAKAERGGVTSSLNVLDLTPARLTTRFSAAEMGQYLLNEFGLLGHAGKHKKPTVLKGVPNLPPGMAAYQAPAGVRVTNQQIAKKGLPSDWQDRSKARKVGRILESGKPVPSVAVKASGYGHEKDMQKALRRHEIVHSIQSSKRGFRTHKRLRDLVKDEVGAYATMNRRVKGGSKVLRAVNAVAGVPVSVGMGILGNKKLQDRALLRGAQASIAGGGAMIATGASMMKREKAKKLKEMGWAPFDDDGQRQGFVAFRQFAEGEPRKNRTRDLRDKIGLARDVAGLGVVGGIGYGAHRLYKKGSAAVAQAGPKIDAAMQQVKDTAAAWKHTADSTNKNVQRVGRLAGDVKRRLDAPKRKVMIESRMKLRNEKRRAAGKAPSNLSKAMQGKGVKAPKMAVGLIQRLMLSDPRVMRQFESAPRRSKLQNVRDAALTGAGVAVTGAGVAAAMKAREAGKVADNIRNTTAIGADVGKVYRKARKVVTDSVDAFKGGMREAAGKPAPSWAKRTVRIGKKLRLLESREPSFKFQVSSSKARMNEFILGALGTIAGTLAGSAAGARFRYPVQNALKKKLVPKLGKTWGKRVARAGSFAPENAGALAGGAVGSFLTGGVRKRKEEEQFSVRGSRLNQLAWQALHQFGGREQLKDIDRGGFLDPVDVFIGRKKGYTAEQVKDYNRQKRYISDVKSKKRKGSPEAIKAAEDLMAEIRGNPTDAGHMQVMRSALRKGDTVRKVAERGGGLIRDAAKELRGEGREKDRWGREKKREWEKPWFQRTKSQVLGAGALMGGAWVLRKNPKFRAKSDRFVRNVQRSVNERFKDTFPGVEPLRKKGDKTRAVLAAQNAAAAKAKLTKTQAMVNQAGQNIAKQAAAVKPAPKPAGKSARITPMPKAPAPASQKSVVSSQKSEVKAPPPPVSSSASPWAQSKLVNEAPVKAASKPKKPRKDPPGTVKQFNRLLMAQAGKPMLQFEKPFAGYNPKRHARTGGLNDSFRKSYNREHGSNLKRPVTTPPSKLKPGSEAHGRRKSFCGRMSGMPGPTSKGGKLTPKGAALRRWNCMAIQALTQFADPLDVGWDIRDARGNSARVFAPHAGQRDRRPKRWHERVENERKLWAGAAAASTLAGGAAMRKILGKQTKQTVDREVKRRVAQIGAAVKKRYTVKRAPGSGGGRAPNVVPFTPKEAA